MLYKSIRLDLSYVLLITLYITRNDTTNVEVFSSFTCIYIPKQYLLVDAGESLFWVQLSYTVQTDGDKKRQCEKYSVLFLHNGCLVSFPLLLYPIYNT
jgi:hypothetical protein